MDRRTVEGIVRILFPDSLADGSLLGVRGRVARPFLVGPENALAATVAEAILRDDVSLSPVVIHGPSGCGKSHFVQGLAASYSARYPKAAVVVTRACELPVHYIGSHHFPLNNGAHNNAAHNNPAHNEQETDDSLQADLLVIEDIDELHKKPTTQQRLLHTIDAVYRRQGLMAMTSRLAVARLSDLLPSLRSRLMAGLAVHLALPALPTREALVGDFAAQLSVAITDEAARALAVEVADGASPLRAALQTLVSTASQTSRLIDVDAVYRFLRQRNPAPRIGLRSVALRAAHYFRVPLPDLQSTSRARSVVEARAVAMYLARQLTSKSLGQIGAYFGGRDHTTVMHNCRRTEELLMEDASTQSAVAVLRHDLIGSKLNECRQRIVRRGKPVAAMSRPNL